MNEELIDRVMANAKILGKLAKYYDKLLSKPSVGPMVEFNARRYCEVLIEQERLLEQLKNAPP